MVAIVDKEKKNFKIKVSQVKSASTIITDLPKAEVYLIGGPSGAGKTEFAQIFRRFRSTVVVSLDNYFIDEDFVRFSVSSKYGLGRQWDHPSSVDIELAFRNVMDLLRQGHTQVPIFSFAENKRLGYKTCKRTSKAAILVEGLHALLLRPYLHNFHCKAYAIFMDATVPIRRSRVSARDAKTRGRSLSDFERRFHFMRIAETRWILPQRRAADLLVDTSDGFFRVERRT